MTQRKNSIKYNAVMNTVFTMSGMLFQLITFPYVSRVLLATGTGKVSFYNSLQSYCVLVAALGISTYGIRAVAKVRDDKDRLSQTVKELLALNSMATTVVLLILLLLSVFIPRLRSEPSLLLISFLFIAFSPVATNWLYSGIEQYGYVTKRSVLFKLISAILIFVFVKNPSDYPIYALILAFSSVGSDICNWIYSRKFVNWGYKSKLNLRQHIRPTLVLFASLLAINFYINLDTVMLGFIKDDRAVGIYSLAAKGKLVLLQAINAISAVLLPRLSYYVGQGDNKSYNKLLKKSVSTILMIAIPIAVFFMLDAENCIMILGGKDYHDSISCLRILMPILIISGFSNITGNQILIPNNREKFYMQAVVTGSIVDIILNFFFIKRLSFNGAAIATLAAELTQMSIQTFHSRAYLKGNFKLNTVFKIVISALIAMCITYFTVFKKINMNFFLDFIIDACVYFVVYGVCLILFREPTLHDYISNIGSCHREQK